MMQTKVDGEHSRRLESRFCRTLEQARKIMAYWQAECEDAADVHRNSDMGLATSSHGWTWTSTGTRTRLSEAAGVAAEASVSG
jgi:hypothetical protein